MVIHLKKNSKGELRFLGHTIILKPSIHHTKRGEIEREREREKSHLNKPVDAPRC